MDTEQEKNTTEAVVTTDAVITAEPTTSAAVVPPAIPFYKNKQNIIAAGIALVLLLGAGYYVYSTQYAQGGVVALVNGEKIYRDALEKNIRSMEGSATQQGIDVTDPMIQEEIQTQSLQVLIDSTLLLKTVKEAGITATDEQVQEKYNEIIEQVGSEEALLTELKTIEVTPEELRENLYERALVDNYTKSLMSPEELEVTDTDITEFLSAYDSAELPPIDEIRDVVKEQILLQRQQEVLSGIVEKVRTEAVIERKI